jgi:DNA polymerase III gamma/tau subunit
MSNLFPEVEQSEMDFPMPLVEKYRPIRVQDFIALETPKAILSTLLKRPRPCNLIFSGPPGTGKTTLALAFAKELNAGLIHYPAQTLTVEAVKSIWEKTTYYPEHGGFWVVVVDEIETASLQARYALLSKMDSAANLAPAFGGGMREVKARPIIFIMTANGEGDAQTEVKGMFEPRFLSRCLPPIAFNKPNGELSAYLAAIWDNEGASSAPPDFMRIADDADHCVRDALQALDLALMMQGPTVKDAEPVFIDENSQYAKLYDSLT